MFYFLQKHSLIFFSFLCLFCLNFSVFAQSPSSNGFLKENLDSQAKTLLFKQVIGGAKNDKIVSVIQTSDSGYLLAGETESFSAGGRDIFIVKLDATGKIIWSKTIGGENYDVGNLAIENSSGDYFIIGETSSFGTNYNIPLILKFDSLGNFLEAKTVEINDIDSIAQPDGFIEHSVIPTLDNGWLNMEDIFTGTNWPGVFLFKFNSSGNLIWTKQIVLDREGFNNYPVSQIIQTADEGYVLIGNKHNSGELNNEDNFIIKLDSSGDLIWAKTIRGENKDVVYSVSSIIQTKDGNYLIGGEKMSIPELNLAYDQRNTNREIFLLRLDSSGNSLWVKSIKGIDNNLNPDQFYFFQNFQGEYIIFGNTHNNDIFVLKLNDAGNFLWGKIIGNEDYENISSVIQLPDNGYAAVGEVVKKEFQYKNNDILFLKFDSFGNLLWAKITGETTKNEFSNSVLQTIDGGYCIAGYQSDPKNSDTNILLLKTDSFGNFQEQSEEIFQSIKITSFLPDISSIAPVISSSPLSVSNFSSSLTPVSPITSVPLTSSATAESFSSTNTPNFCSITHFAHYLLIVLIAVAILALLISRFLKNKKPKDQ